MPDIGIGSFLVIIFTLLVNIAVMRYERSKGRLLKSDILISDSLHTKADIFVSLSVIAALTVIKLGYPLFDPIITIVISLFIAYLAYNICKRSSNILCDASPMIDVKKISHIVLSIKGVKACHKIRMRGSTNDIHIDLHVQVSPNMHVDHAHKISYSIENAIKQNIPQITDVVLHIEPQEEK
jgi:cation diffusion facilitator family transporter